MTSEIREELTDTDRVKLALFDEMVEALDDCLPLALAWMNHYSLSPIYGGTGTAHPTHQKITNNARAVLAKVKELS